MAQDIQRAAIDLYDRFTHEGMDRRDFLARLTRIAGSAAAASILLADIAAKAAAQPQVAADDRRLVTRTMAWEARPGRRYRGYSAAPAVTDGRGPPPVIVVIHENRGLNDHIRDVARRFALAGFAALAPDWLSPAGGTPAGDEDRARTMIGQLDMAEAVADGVGSIAWLGGSHRGRRKVGIVGFCWGGAMVNWLATQLPTLAAAAPFYGSAPPLGDVPAIRAEMLHVLAANDERVNAGWPAYEAALQAAGVRYALFQPPGTEHGFHNDTTPRYAADAAAEAWKRTLELFERTLAA